MYSDLEVGAHGPAVGHAAAQTHSEGGRNPPQQLPALVHRPIGVDSQGPREQLLVGALDRSEEHTSELQSLMRISYADSCLNTNSSNIFPTDAISFLIHTIYLS